MPTGGPVREIEPLRLDGIGEAISENDLQELIHSDPGVLPVLEVDPAYAGAIAVCRELRVATGAVDNFLLTSSGFPVLVECKLWRNPEGRREVVGQILDYARELSRWTSADVRREVSKRTGKSLMEIMRAAAPDLDEARFDDMLTRNLRRGRFLLLIVGDGIREGVETIAEYVQARAGLHFSLGLIELPFYRLPDGSRLVVPRVIVRTEVISRTIVELPNGMAATESQDNPAPEADADRSALGNEQRRFWEEFLPFLKLDDPSQEVPKPPRQGFMAFPLPAPSGTSWLTVYRDLHRGQVGVFLSSSRNSSGERAMLGIAEDWSSIRPLLGGSAKLEMKDGRPRMGDSLDVGPLDQPQNRTRAFEWLAERVNAFVNVMRPLVRASVSDQSPTPI